ncbi:hypothetical protein [Chryseosolibacter indicus]|uniref:DUF4136 domain-containing protein n=1 Tax=Chryseosolibacter indicus TaxID=2782351 RepID=A0ABS5VM65_9BACT|nr:hypothetical protein [Chryseosolibacter indicus]MBT1702206.1 hypothetical protein [Chryseosolibacter indicus]
MQRKRIVLYAVLVFCFAACQPATEITGSWKNTNATANNQRFNTILVTALTARTNVRQQVERDIAAALEKRGYKTVKSFDVLPPFTEGKTPDKEVLFSKINQTGANAIMTVALIDKETENRYVPGSTGYAPVPRFGYYGSFWGYYNTWFPTLYSPGYYEEDKVYFIETNLYNARTEELLWSGQSETYNPSSLDSFSREFAQVVVAKMENDGLLRKDASGEELAKERGKERSQ